MKKWCIFILAVILPLTFLSATNAEAKKIVRFGNDIVVDENMTVEKVVAIGGNITVNGVVKDEVVAIGGNIFLGQKAKVGNKVVAIGGKIHKEVGTQIGDDEVELNIPSLSSCIDFCSTTNWLGWVLAFKIIAFIGFVGLAILIVAVIPKPFDLISTNVQKNTLQVILWGILGLVVLLPLTFFLIISIIGIPLVALEVFLVGIAFIVGYIAIAKLIGDKLAEALRRPGLNILWATLLGLFTLWVIGWVPFLGSLVKAVVLVLGFGGVIATIFSSVNRQREEKVI